MSARGIRILAEFDNYRRLHEKEKARAVMDDVDCALLHVVEASDQVADAPEAD